MRVASLLAPTTTRRLTLARRVSCFTTNPLSQKTEHTTDYGQSHTATGDFTHKVGVVFDIDGVLVRGRKVIECAQEAIEKLTRRNIPVIYLTNGGCQTEAQRAEELTAQLNLNIDVNQVVLSHSPIRILNPLHHKHVAVSGQGPVSDIAKMCGFSSVSHVDDIADYFPHLDVNDRAERCKIKFRKDLPPFTPVEGILLMGEPVKWERTLQILLDLILTNGNPTALHSLQSHLPVVAVNTDFLWMSEAHNPRIGHGGFLICLEAMYKKHTGKKLEYKAILGKPNILTYRYTEGVILDLAQQMSGEGSTIRTIYGIGDNIDTDIYGANLYNNYLRALQGSDLSTDALHPGVLRQSPLRMKSILVRTGVSGHERTELTEVNHLHRDTVYRAELSVPTYMCKDVLHAVDTILQEEDIS